MAKRINKPLDIKRVMEDNPLATGFVLEAIHAYARAQLTAPDWGANNIIDQGYWRSLAGKALDVIDGKRSGTTVPLS
jgi:hypothetical protein